jgi:hypothetical protein
VLLLLAALGAPRRRVVRRRAAPRLVVAAWAAVCFLVPIWVGVQAGVYWSAVTAATIIALAAWSTDGLTFSYVDVLVVGFVVLVVAAYLVGGSTWGHVLIVLFGWLVPYAWGRVRARAGRRVVAVRDAIAASRSSLPCSASSSSPPASTPSSASPCRTAHGARGTTCSQGRVRPRRGAFGHSIAFASALAMSSVFVLVAEVAGMGAARRAPCRSSPRVGDELQPHRADHARDLARARLLLLGRWVGRTMRLAVVVLLVAATAVIAPLIGDVFTAAGEEAGGSAEYRSDPREPHRRHARPRHHLGLDRAAHGETYYGTFQSIDSELVLTGLRFGSLPLLVVIAAIVACVLSLLRGRATPASVASPRRCRPSQRSRSSRSTDSSCGSSRASP